MGKSMFVSRTFWFNVLSSAATIVGLAQGILPPSAAPYIAGATALINIGLRWITTGPVHVAPK